MTERDVCGSYEWSDEERRVVEKYGHLFIERRPVPGVMAWSAGEGDDIEMGETHVLDEWFPMEDDAPHG